MTSRNDVYAALDSERDYQDMRKSRDQGQEFHSVEEFLLYMEDYLHEARNVASRTWGPEAKPKTLEVLRKVTALGVACMEIHGAPQRAGFERDRDQPTRHIVLDIGHAIRQLQENPELGSQLIGMIEPEFTKTMDEAEARYTKMRAFIESVANRPCTGLHHEAVQQARDLLSELNGADFEPVIEPAPVQVGPLPAGPVEHRPNSETYDANSTLTREPVYVPPQPGEPLGPDDDEIPF